MLILWKAHLQYSLDIFLMHKKDPDSKQLVVGLWTSYQKNLCHEYKHVHLKVNSV